MLLLLKNLLFSILVPGTVAGFLPYWLFGPYVLASRPAVVVGSTLVIAGLTLYFACIWPFARIGRGTPAPIDAPVRLIEVGPYRFVRNPMYVAVLSAIFGQAVIAGSAGLALYGLGVGVVFHVFVIGYEERALERQFGEDYGRYRDRVPRWLPRFSWKKRSA